MTGSQDTQPPSPRDLKARIEAERTGLPFLYWRDDAGEQHILMLGEDSARVTIGRREQADVPLAWDQEVSRAHALLEPVGDEWTLVDDGLSRNGSYVNGGRVAGRQRLHDGDRLCFGKTYVFYCQPTNGRGGESTARAGDKPAPVPLSDRQRKVLIALCRPVKESRSATPATNPQIAAEVHLSVDAVKAHLRPLFDRFGLADLPQNEKRTRLVEVVLSSGLLAPHDF